MRWMWLVWRPKPGPTRRPPPPYRRSGPRYRRHHRHRHRPDRAYPPPRRDLRQGGGGDSDRPARTRPPHSPGGPRPTIHPARTYKSTAWENGRGPPSPPAVKSRDRSISNTGCSSLPPCKSGFRDSKANRRGCGTWRGGGRNCVERGQNQIDRRLRLRGRDCGGMSGASGQAGITFSEG